MQQIVTADGVAPAVEVTAAERFVALYRQLFPSVYGFVRFRVGDVHVAEDITAVVFERALRRLRDGSDDERTRAWVFAVARNAIADHYRGLERTRSLDGVGSRLPLIDPPDEFVEREDDRRRIVELVGRLDDREREVIGLRYVGSLSHRAVANVVGCSEANAAQIAHRAVQKLRRWLADE